MEGVLPDLQDEQHGEVPPLLGVMDSDDGLDDDGQPDHPGHRACGGGVGLGAGLWWHGGGAWVASAGLI